MSRPPDPILRRLALISHLYRDGAEQSRKPDRLAGFAVLTFHNAVELYLFLVCQHLDISVSTSIPFMRYWEEVSQLGHKGAMQRLNEDRKKLKHQGSFPSQRDVEDHRVAVRSFFREHTPTFFGVDFSEVSLVLLVPQQEVQDLLEEAESSLSAGELHEASEATAKAMYIVINQLEGRFSRLLRFPEFTEPQRQTGGVPVFVSTLRHELDAIEDALAFIYTGVDLDRYAEFERLTPGVLRAMAGNWELRWHGGRPDLEPDDVEFLIKFTVETALKVSD
jgi:hypothetical protein